MDVNTVSQRLKRDLEKLSCPKHNKRVTVEINEKGNPQFEACCKEFGEILTKEVAVIYTKIALGK